MKTLDDLLAEGVDGSARAGARRPERPARRATDDDDHRRRPHPRRAADDRGAARRRRARHRLLAPRPAEGRAGPEVRPRAGRRPAGRAARRRRRVRHRHGRRLAPGRRGRAGRRRRGAAGEPAVQRGRDQQGRRPSGARSRAQLAAFGDAYVDDAFGAVHRKHASVYDVAALLPHYAGRLVAQGTRRAEPADRRARSGPTSSCSAARRSPTSSPSSRRCCRRSTSCSSAAACASRSSRRRATRSASRCSRTTWSTPARDLLDAGRRQDRAADRHRGGGRVRGRRRVRRRSPADAIPADWLGLDIGPDSVAAFADGPRRREDGVLERPDGRVRDGAVRGRYPGRGRGDHQGRRLHASSAAATRPRRCARSASTRTRSATSPPVAARRWNTSRARRCPAFAALED